MDGRKIHEPTYPIPKHIIPNQPFTLLSSAKKTKYHDNKSPTPNQLINLSSHLSIKISQAVNLLKEQEYEDVDNTLNRRFLLAGNALTYL